LLLLAVPLLAQAPQDRILRSGPMIGYAEISETALWLQTWRPAAVQIRYWKKGAPESARLSAIVRTAPEGDHIARFTIPALEFGTEYEYEVYLDGKRAALPFATEFATQPMWRWRTEPPAFVAAVGSCAYVNDAPFDRPGAPYGGETRIFTSIANGKPDLMLWIGDNVYYREADWESESGMRYRYAHTRSLPELQPLFASTPQYATWDDHDYGPNDSDRTYPLKDVSLQIFADYWPSNRLGSTGVPGVFQKFTWADVDFFLLDDRYHRSPNDMPPSAAKMMWGEAQLAWLVESLASSSAPFKVVVNGNQVLNRNSREEALPQFAEFEPLRRAIRDAKIEGVVFVSGDRHHGILFREQVEGMYPLYELTTSPLTAGVAQAREGTDFPYVVPGTYYPGRNYATLSFDGPRTDRRVTIRLHDVAGKAIWERSIEASELRFPR
ncbi:MAG TPA: alkaline phosphatase D family protein, partial [Thermoanaerobaculia bacterium]